MKLEIHFLASATQYLKRNELFPRRLWAAGSVHPENQSALRPFRWLNSFLCHDSAMMHWMAGACLLCACESKNAETPHAHGGTVRDTQFALEPCRELSDLQETGDANADGKPDVWEIRRSGLLHCRAVDLNFDGSIERTSFFDNQGRLRRVESDFDRDRQVDEVVLYREGVMTERQRSTLHPGKLDTWELYQAGKLTMTERDTDGNGLIDQWWEHKTDTCELVHSDTDGDGLPEPQATVGNCPEQNAGAQP